ncbi:bifunctional riboflavin kinase/FAD synthetase [Geobacter sp. DSM 9736]|uniref:bifunctional riboflavin kinase/FAD synthetase n=1 Tax=Geobacter sp. DSM 9736 TaxID=1277350 RepID=UPI000B50E1F3|nr:bifunctional riboflavin kinase/FAD synthetase [Geobacter sp. DSM 9736]SNB45847.1 FMN adenylyltransferase /riboflavin kinase [Geobacter sp. DSM 9736]
MRVFRAIEDITGGLPSPVATIGNFDGVHLGHREIFRRVRSDAARLGGVSVVITFVPHPLKVVPSGKDLRLISTCAEKEALIEASGIDVLVAIPFDRTFASVSAEEFVRGVLVGRIGIRKLIIGSDYRFGRSREGDVSLLQHLGGELGFEVDVMEPVGDGRTTYSSSLIRSMVSAGDVAGVVALLGRHFSLAGKVVHGHHRGSGLGFPTANIATEKELLPKNGVYAVKVKVDSEVYEGACNIGVNPTFSNQALSVEVFLFDFEEDLYDREIRVYFIERVRDERKFPDVEALKLSIAADVARCREILSHTRLIEYPSYLTGD